MYAANPEYVKSKYNLPMLREVENLVAEAVEVNVPFSNPITYVLALYTYLKRLETDYLAAATARSRTRPASTPRRF